jgi:hypothetical protein
MFHVLFVRKNFFHPNLRGGSPEKIFPEKIFCYKATSIVYYVFCPHHN